MRAMYTVAYKCDRCGKEAEGGRWNWNEKSSPAPDGWLLGTEVLRIEGIVMRDLCDDCSGLPMRRIAQEMKADA